MQSPYSAQYAFVGIGSHALQNLYPVLQYLGIRLKYICCKSPDKLALIERRFGVTATTSLDTILNDSEVEGVFLYTSPQSHYDICTRVIEAGKNILDFRILSWYSLLNRYYFDSRNFSNELAYIIHSGFISGYQNRYGDNLKPPTNVYHRMTA